MEKSGQVMRHPGSRVRRKSAKILNFQRIGVFLCLSDRNVDGVDGQSSSVSSTDIYLLLRNTIFTVKSESGSNDGQILLSAPMSLQE
jgi:hypothetical protein